MNWKTIEKEFEENIPKSDGQLDNNKEGDTYHFGYKHRVGNEIHGVTDWGNILNFFKERCVPKEEEPFDTKDIPMGVSQWLNHGKKYGYADFFHSTQDVLEMIGEDIDTDSLSGDKVRALAQSYNKAKAEMREKLK